MLRSRTLMRAARRWSCPQLNRMQRLLSTGALDLSQYDDAQLQMMEEMCILVDYEDRVVGEDTKKNVHLIDGVCMRGDSVPHRAFSVFLFDENWSLLLQKRCSEKILFPLHWANTCCSHPLAEGATFLGERVYGESDGAAGTIRAARRKLEQELGISAEAVPEESFRFVTKVHYKAPLPGLEPQWGEHEVDYILLCQRSRAVIEETLSMNPNEVEDVRWVCPSECRSFVDSPGDELISPWFGAIERELLHPWWKILQEGEVVNPDGEIHRLAGGLEAMSASTHGSSK